MLKLLIFIPCEKIIVAEGGQTSAIGILEAVHIAIPKGKEPVADAMMPYKWGVLTLWHREIEVPQPVMCKTRIVMLRPDSGQMLEIGTEFEVSDTYSNYRQNIDLPFLPMGIEGTYQLKLFLKEGDNEEREVAIFPMVIDHQLKSDLEFVEVGDKVTVGARDVTQDT